MMQPFKNTLVFGFALGLVLGCLGLMGHEKFIFVLFLMTGIVYQVFRSSDTAD